MTPCRRFYNRILNTTIMEKKHNISTNEAEKKYPGVDIDKSVDEKVTPKMVKQETKELNNNPRNNDIDL